MKSQPLSKIIDSRHLKILAAKKDMLKDAVVFISLDENRYGEYDIANLRKMLEVLDNLEPTGCYFLSLKDQNIQIYDMAQFKNRDLLITINDKAQDVDKTSLEEQFSKALPCAKSISFIYQDASIKKR